LKALESRCNVPVLVVFVLGASDKVKRDLSCILFRIFTKSATSSVLIKLASSLALSSTTAMSTAVLFGISVLPSNKSLYPRRFAFDKNFSSQVIQSFFFPEKPITLILISFLS
jgi:hypothetical protein